MHFGFQFIDLVSNMSILSTLKSRFLLFLLMLMMTMKSRADLPGTWELLVENAGISSMHTVVTHFNVVVLLDRTNSSLFDPSTKYIRPLTILTDTLCSSGQFLPDGTLLQTGGNNRGTKKIRKFTPCKGDAKSLCDWEKFKDVELAQSRWYASNQIFPEGSMIIVGGRNAATVEYFPPRAGGIVMNFPFLKQAGDAQMDNLYPCFHLIPNGHLFVFANNKSVLYDYTKNVVLKQYPDLKGGPRNYPSAMSSVMLELTGDHSSVTIVV